MIQWQDLTKSRHEVSSLRTCAHSDNEVRPGDLVTLRQASMSFPSFRKNRHKLKPAVIMVMIMIISATSLISSWVVRQAIDLPVISAGNNLTIIIWMTTTTVVYDLPHIRMQKVKRELQFSP